MKNLQLQSQVSRKMFVLSSKDFTADASPDRKLSSPLAWSSFFTLLLFLSLTQVFSQTATITYSTNGTQTFLCPPGVTTVQVDCWGAGGGGGNGANGPTTGGGGGGGGAYTRTNSIAVTAGNSYSVVVGLGGAGGPASSATSAVAGGDSYFDAGAAALAKGGSLGSNTGTAGAGGATASSVGDTKRVGGNGFAGPGNGGGGGGSSAGTALAGVDATGTGATTAPAGGGDGGAGTTGANGSNGSTPGGAGGGGDDLTTSFGGNGADGRVILVFADVTKPDVTINENTGQADPTNGTMQFKAVFSEAINPASFSNGDIALTGTATGKAVSLRTTTDNITWIITVTASGGGTVIANIAAGLVDDFSAPSANTNTISTSSDNQITYDNGAPTASAPISVAQTLRGGVTSTSNVQSTEDGEVYLFLSTETTPTTLAQITTLIGLNKAFIGASVTAAIPSFVTPGASLIGGVYDIVAADDAGNVSPKISGWLTVDNVGPTSTATYTKNPIKNGDAQTVTVTFGEAVTGTPKATVTGSTIGVIVNNLNMTGGPTTWTISAGSVFATDAEVFTVTVGTATDAAGNLVNTNPLSNTFVVDNVAPASAAITAVTTNAGGTVVAGFYNISNVANTAGITVSVTIPNDPTLVNGTVQILVDDQLVAGFIDIVGGSASIPTANVTQNVAITHAVLSAIGTRYADNKTLSFRARITDAAGNPFTGPTAGATLAIDLTAPSNENTVFASNALQIGGGAVTIVSSGTASNNVWFVPTGTTVFTAGATKTTAGGTATSILAPATAGAYKMVVVDAAGNPSAESTATLTVLTAPTTQASALNFPAIGDVTMRLAWTIGNGSRRLVIARPGAAVVDEPINFTTYSPSAVAPFGTAIGTGNVVFDGTAAFVDLTNLVAGQTYHFAVYEYNGASTATGVFRTPGALASQITFTQATNITFTPVSGTSITFGWSNGTGATRIGIVKTLGATFSPSNGATYTANTDFGSTGGGSADLDVSPTDVARCVFKGAGNSVTITDLIANTTYTFQVYELFGGAGSEIYFGAAATGNPANRNTITGLAAVDAEGISNGTKTASTIQLTWTNGTQTGITATVASGTGAIATLTFSAQPLAPYPVGSVISVSGGAPAGYNNATATVTACTTTQVSYASTQTGALTTNPVIKSGGRVLMVKATDLLSPTDLPFDGVSYTYNGLNFGAGTPIGAGTVVYSEPYGGTGSTGVIVTGLLPSTTYRFFVVEFTGAQGTGAENYNITGNTNANQAVGVQIATLSASTPTIQAKDIVFTTTTSATTLQFGWTNGNGANGRIAVIKPGSSFLTADEPVGGDTYVGIQDFLTAPALGPNGAKVIYSDAIAGTIQATSPITVTNLVPNTQYVVKVFEFDGTATNESYLLTNGTSDNPRTRTTNIDPSAVYAVTSGTVGNAGIATNLTITFNTPMQLASNAAIAVDADIKTFVHLEDATTNGAIPFTSSIVGNVITVVPGNSNIPGNKLTGSRDYNFFIDNNEIETTQAEVPLPTSTQPIVATTLVEPLNQPTLPTTGSTTTTITLGWTDATGGQLPENYLILGIESPGSFPVIADGTDPALDIDFSDGTLIMKVAHGLQTLNITAGANGVKSGQPYAFQIYSYTNESGFINFNLTSPLTPLVTTPFGSATTVETGGGSLLISSLTTDLATATAALANFSFDVNDDGATDVVDNSPTRITQVIINRDAVNDETVDWTNVIGGAILTDGTNSMNSFASPGSFVFANNSIAISSIPAALGLVADNNVKTYELKIWLKTSITAIEIDNKNFVFQLTGADFSVATVNSSAFSGASSTTSGVGNNSTVVTASKLLFVQGPSGTYFNLPMTPAVTVETVDAFDNRDLDNTALVSIASTGFLTGDPVSVLAASGLATFPALAHSIAGVGFTLSATSTVPILTPTGPSNTFGISDGSDIAADVGFVYPINIPYDTHQEPADITNSATSLVVAGLILRDGGVAPVDPDANSTILTDLTLNLGPNFANIRRIALYDGAGTFELAATTNDQFVLGPNVTFNGLSLAAADDNAIPFTIRVSFQNTVTDNQQISFTVISASYFPLGSAFAALNAGGATTSLTGDNNRIEVLATNLGFVQGPTTNTYINDAMNPAVTVEAVDNLNNRDLDNASSVSMTSTGTLTGSPVIVVAASGLATFPALAHSVAQVGRTLAATSTGPVLTPTGASGLFDILPPSNASDIIANTGFIYPSNIAYNTFQEPTDIVNSATSIVVGKFDIRDGGGAADGDFFSTVLTNLTLDLGPNFALIRRIALFDAAGTTPLAGVSEQPGGTQLISFSGLSAAAPDNSFLTFSIRVSFQDPVTDNLQFSLTVTSTATVAINSSFAAPDAGGNSSSVLADRNRIEVFATKLLFVQGPTTNTYVNVSMTPAVTVEAVDPLDNRDLDNTSTVSITSTGTLTGTPVLAGVILGSGVATFSTLQHSVAQVGLTISATSTLPVLIPTSPSSPFTILPPSNASNIIANTGFTYPTNIAYDTFQEGADIVNSTTSLVVAQFDIQDGGGAADADPFPTVLTNLTLDLGTNFGLIRRIALFDAAGANQLTGVSEQAVGSQLISFSGLSATAPDNNPLTFSVRVSFQDPVTDNLQFSLTVTSTATLAINSSFAAINAGGNSTSVLADINRIEVLATKLLFVQGPSDAYINIAMSPAVTVQSVDALDNRDLDNTSPISITSTGTLTGTPVVVAASSGLATFPALFHSVAQAGRTLSATAAGLSTTGASATFTILPPSNTSNIIANTGFVYPTNIDYKTIQEPTDIVNSATSIVVAQFDIQDGGGAADGDIFPTVLTDLTLDLGPNFAFIRNIALFNAAGTTQLTGVAEQVVGGSQLVSFSGLSVSAPDGGSITFSVRVSFKTLVTDNQQFTLLVNNTSTLAINSSFAATNAGAAISSITGNNNRIEVTASKIFYTSVSAAAFISAPFPVTVEARDINNNIDLDNNEAVVITNAGGLITSPIPATVGPFGSGVLSFSFAYLTPGDGTLSMTTGTITSAQVSPPISVSASAQSRLYLNGVYSPRIPYINHTQNPLPLTGTIVTPLNPFILGTFVLFDGDAATGDPDLANTVLQQLTISLTNPSYIKRIALYDALGNIIGTDQAGGTSPITFSGLSITALDNTATPLNSTTFTVRASFESTTVVDEQNIQMEMTVATETVGSNFAPGVGGVPAGPLRQSPATGANVIDVIATAMVFTQDPPPAVGTYQPVPISPIAEVQVQARDANGKLDTEFDGTSFVTFTLAGASPSSLLSPSFPFSNGIATVLRDNLQYTQEGDGTLTANATNPPPTVGGVTPDVSTTVDVHEVRAIYSFGGVLTPPNLASGSIDKVIYGVTFSTNYRKVGQPKLEQFKISFDFLGGDILTVIKASTVKVFEQIDNNIFGSGTDVTDPSINGVVTPTSTGILVDLSANPRDFSVGPTTTYTYFLQVDIEGTANSSTPALTPFVEDTNWNTGANAFDATNANIIITPLNASVTTQGGGRADKLSTIGQSYSFAAIFPPKLISSNPVSGAINMNPNGNLVLTFDVPVYTLNGKIYLHSTASAGAPGILIDSLSLVGLNGSNLANKNNTITFGPLPGLAYNSLYYISIPAVNANLTKGIVDEPGNRFAGISSPSTLYFRTASNIAPRLLSGGSGVPTVPFITQIRNISLTGAVIQTTFDRPGTAYFVVTNAGAPAPTRAQILGLGNTAGPITGVDYGVADVTALTRGIINIDQVAPIAKYGIINYPLVNNAFYDVWMFAINNDLPNNLTTSGPYGGVLSGGPVPAPSEFSTVADGTGTRTFNFQAINPGAIIPLPIPSIQVCTGSYQPMNTPIRVVEVNNGDFLGTGTPSQNFNLYLPLGFQFDISKPGKVDLSGSDFSSPLGSTQFLSASVVQINYPIDGTSASLDAITISGLYVLATTAANGQIKKLGGSISALVIPENKAFADLKTNPVTPPNFINSSVGAVSFLPDSISSPVGHPEFEVQLIPSLAAGDYGPSTFSGSGVNGDLLFLKSVTLSQPFLITMLHKDNNGCVSTVSNQYLVYDHTTGLGIDTKYCISPRYFPVVPPLPGSYPTKYTVSFTDFPGFYMTDLITKTVGSGTFLNTLSIAPGGPVTGLPLKLISSQANPANNPKPGDPFALPVPIPPQYYYDFNFYVTRIDSTNWETASGGVPSLPYRKTTGRLNPYYSGGSLGSVEFKGLYQSIASVTLSDVPITQNAEFYAPALPYIEVSNNYTTIDIADALNLPSPPNNLVTLGNAGTYLYCQAGGTITLNGFPQASSVSSGTFALYNHVTNLPINLTIAQGFQDFANGTATIDPTSALLISALGGTGVSGFQDLRVTYTYKDNNSPCQSITYVVIRITPNPVADFTTSTTCEDLPITFSSTSTISGGAQYPITRWRYLFADPNSSPANNIDTLTLTGITNHVYSASGNFPNVSLSVVSSVGCRSVSPQVKTLSVGGTPVVGFSYDGVSTADVFNFTASTSSVSTNDTFNSLFWTFGDGGTLLRSYVTQPEYTTTAVTHSYFTAGPGRYVTDLRVTSGIGCVANLSDISSSPVPESRSLLVLKRESATPVNAYEANFELGDFGWQSWYASTSSAPLALLPGPNQTPPPSWMWMNNPADRTFIKKDPAVTGTGFWATDSLGLSGKYSPKERSGLYSPSFDLRALKAPMLAFNSAVNMQLSDGVIVEYSQDNKNVADPNKVWHRLGSNLGEGVDWFTDKGISAKPGAQVGGDFGWSNTRTVWFGPKHTIDTIKITGVAAGILEPFKDVVFRFALASLSTEPLEGFAVDNFFIGDRTRTILLESFQNTGNNNTSEQQVNDSIRVFPRSIVGTKVIKINYHVNFPKDDPFNLDNPVDPSSRASYYGITSTPKSRLDGSRDSLDRSFTSWGFDVYGKRSLQLAQADLVIKPTVTSDNISIMVEVDAKFDLPPNTVLHVAVVEDSISASDLPSGQQILESGETGFNSVFKKLLPSASGTKFGTALLSADPVRAFGPFDYKAGKLYPSTPNNDLRIIAFLQREDGDREIFQVSDTTGFTDPSVITGLEPIASERVLVYPNPANREMTVQLPGQLTKPAVVQLIDQTGRVALHSSIPEGADRKTFNVNDLSSGVYILTIDMGSGVLTRKKVVIVHQE